MSAGVISWTSHLANVTGHPHDIGYCPRFDPEGTQLVRWIEVISGQCVYGALGAVSWSFGIPLFGDVSDLRLPVDLIMAVCAATSNHLKLSKPLRRGTCSYLSHQLVHGISPHLRD
jgi:hypothetical protein